MILATILCSFAILHVDGFSLTALPANSVHALSLHTFPASNHCDGQYNSGLSTCSYSLFTNRGFCNRHRLSLYRGKPSHQAQITQTRRTQTAWQMSPLPDPDTGKNTKEMEMPEESLNLPPKLKSYADGLRNVPDDKLRYKQLLFLAAQCKPLDPALKIPENKVPGCLSTVHVHATIDHSDGKITFLGDSDAQLTKGLVSLLVNGLTGCTAEEIIATDPEFIKYAGIATSLTPGRNNGFLNMLNVMKAKARQLAEERDRAVGGGGGNQEREETDGVGAVLKESGVGGGVGQGGQAVAVDFAATAGGPVYQSMYKKLSMLKPIELDIIDDSAKHAGHSGTQGLRDGETHFTVKIVAECFAGLSRVQRHQMVYALLSQEMQGGVHALSIQAKTPEE